MKFFLLILLFLFTIIPVFSGELVIKGIYQGKNVFVQNPYNVERKEFCTEEVYVNDVKVLSAIKNSAYSINLSSLEIGTPVQIKILYKGDCTPKIINAFVLQSDEKYTFNNVAVLAQEIKFSINEEVLSGRFIIEKYIDNYWKPVSSVPVVFNQKSYQTPISPFFADGNNRFRVKYLSHKEQVFISPNIEVESNENAATLSLDNANSILLSKETNYEIIDEEGNKIKNGKSKEIAISNLDPGTYYINYENKSEKFLKK